MNKLTIKDIENSSLLTELTTEEAANVKGGICTLYYNSSGYHYYDYPCYPDYPAAASSNTQSLLSIFGPTPLISG